MIAKQLSRYIMGLALLFGPCGAAFAQTPSVLSEWQFSAGTLLERHESPDPPPGWRFRAGLGASYEGGAAGAS